ncbi:Uma2 family endonuclease [Actinomadura flavalba]|uniref:Uma2 family endonuclease n=1 Tax=Actinomadura flavalba TaxID=1120938 RepID=UPI000379001F|nr:Uma2 family endonuclease [Actinomadura flavalba]
MTNIVEDPAHPVVLPRPLEELWAGGELHDFLHLPHDGTRVEVIGGRIVVSPPPMFRHNLMVSNIADAFAQARVHDPANPWVTVQGSALQWLGSGSGCIPDLIVLDQTACLETYDADAAIVLPENIEIVVEITSKSNAADDRPADPPQSRRTKWSEYAHAGIPYYLLVDRSPKAATTTLYSIPDGGSRAYLNNESWLFGETIRLPDPFNVEIDTAPWRTW